MRLPCGDVVLKMCVVAVDSQLLGTVLDWKFSGGGMVKSGV